MSVSRSNGIYVRHGGGEEDTRSKVVHALHMDGQSSATNWTVVINKRKKKKRRTVSKLRNLEAKSLEEVYTLPDTECGRYALVEEELEGYHVGQMKFDELPSKTAGVAFALELSAIIKESGPTQHEALRELLKRGQAECLDTNVGQEEDVDPPLLSLAKHRESRVCHNDQSLINDLYTLIKDTGGFWPIVNDRRYGVLAMSYCTHPQYLYYILESNHRDDVDWNIPHPTSGHSVWIMANHFQRPHIIRAFLTHIFPRIDLDLDRLALDQLLNRTFEEIDAMRISMEQQIFGHTIPYLSAATETSASYSQCREILWQAIHVTLPIFKTGLVIALRSVLIYGSADVKGPLPPVLSKIIEAFLAL